jgi:ankyrin repeat protein
MDSIDEDSLPPARGNFYEDFHEDSLPPARGNFNEDFHEFDRNNWSGLQKQYAHHHRANLTGAAYHGDIKRVHDILNLKFGGQDIEQTEGGLGSDVYEREMTPLGIAASMGDIDIVRLLIRHRANTNGSGNVDNIYTATPLFAAVKSGNKDIVKLLIKYGAEVNNSMSAHIDTGGGATAMYYAAKHGDLGMAELLYKAGACVMIPTGGGKTPCDIARANNHTAMVDWLLSTQAIQSASNERDGIVKHYFVPDFSKDVGRCYH